MSDMDYKLESDAKEEELYEQMMDRATFRKNRIKVIICMVFFFLADGMELFSFNLLIKPFGDYFEFEDSSVQIQIAASSIFLGIMIGSIIASFLTKKFGRILTINCSNLLFFISYLLKGIWMSFAVFIICKTLTGLALGIIVPIFLNVYGEYLPTKFRGILLMVAWVVFGFGTLITNCLGLVIMPELQKDKLQTFLLALSVFPFLSFISCLILLKDSPRGLLLSKRMEESFSKKALSEIKNENIQLEMTEKKTDGGSEIGNNTGIMNIPETEKSTNNTQIESFSTKDIIKEMFGPSLKKTTILMIIIFIFLGYNAFGIFSITSYFLDYLDEKENGQVEEETIPAREILINQILLAVANIVANLIGGFTGEIRKFGRKGGIITTLILGAITTIIGLFSKILFEVTNPITSGFSEIYVNLVMDYTVELYPTKIRDTSTSLLFFVYRISCFISNYISIGFYDVNIYIPYIIYAVFSVLAAIFTWALPHEMAGKSMN